MRCDWLPEGQQRRTTQTDGGFVTRSAAPVSVSASWGWGGGDWEGSIRPSPESRDVDTIGADDGGDVTDLGGTYMTDLKTRHTSDVTVVENGATEFRKAGTDILTSDKAEAAITQLKI